MDDNTLRQLFKIADMHEVKHTERSKNIHPIYFWTLQGKPFYGKHFNVDADDFYKICKENRFFIELDI